MNDLHGRLYFRTRENGAAVFRVDTYNKSRRLELHQIATVAIRRKEYRIHGDAVVSDTEDAEIKDWIEKRATFLKSQEKSKIPRLIDDIKSVTHWIVSQSEPKDLEQDTEELLLALHDLRTVIVRKKSEDLK